MRAFLFIAVLVTLTNAVAPAVFVTSYPIKKADHKSGKLTLPALSATDNVVSNSDNDILVCGDAGTIVNDSVTVEILATQTTNSPELVGVKVAADLTAGECLVADTKVSVAETDRTGMVQIAVNKTIDANPVHAATDYELLVTANKFAFTVGNADGASFTKDTHLAFACSKATKDVTATGDKAHSIAFAGKIKDIYKAPKGPAVIVVEPVKVGDKTVAVPLSTFGCDATDEKEVYVLAPGPLLVIQKHKIGTIMAAHSAKAAVASKDVETVETAVEVAVVKMAAKEVASGDNKKWQVLFCGATDDLTAWSTGLYLFQATWTQDAATDTNSKLTLLGGDAANKLSDVGCTAAVNKYLYVAPGPMGTAVCVGKITAPAGDAAASGTATIATAAAVGMAAIAAAL